MTTAEPGDRRPGDQQPGEQPPDRVVRRLAEPPSARYGRGPVTAAAGDSAHDDRQRGHRANAGERTRRAPTGARRPLLAGLGIALAGALLLVLVAGVLATTVGLLFIAALMGAGVGLVLAAAAVADAAMASGTPAPASPAPWARQTVSRVAVAIAVGAVLVAAAGTWLYARAEGGALGPVDYLWETFGLLVPAEAIVAALAAAWGASAGPVRGR